MALARSGLAVTLAMCLLACRPTTDPDPGIVGQPLDDLADESTCWVAEIPGDGSVAFPTLRRTLDDLEAILARRGDELAVAVAEGVPTIDLAVALRRGTVTDFDGYDGRAFRGDRDGNGVDDVIVNIAGNDVSGFAVTRITAALPCPP